MLGWCWLLKAFRSFLDAHPQLVLAPRSQTGFLSGSTWAWERGDLEAKNRQNQLGNWICQLLSGGLAHVGLAVACVRLSKPSGR